MAVINFAMFLFSGVFIRLPTSSSFGQFVMPHDFKEGETNKLEHVAKDIECNGTRSSCVGRCGDGNHMPCSCDDVCQSYRDCCYDYQDVCDSLASRDNETVYPGTVCIQTNSRPERVISRCPALYDNTTIVDACQNLEHSASILDRVPVTDTETGLNYRNMYCAVCNRAENIVGWEASVACSRTNTQNQLSLEDLLTRINAGECVPKPTKPKDMHARTCVMDAIQECPKNSNPDTRKQCSAYTSYIKPIAHGQMIYANIHCFMCNNNEVVPDLCFETTEDPVFKKTKISHVYDQSVLVWNPERYTWGLTIASPNQDPLSSELFVCEMRGTISSRCPPPREVPPNMIPYIIRFTIQVKQNPLETRATDVIFDISFNNVAIFEEAFGNLSWKSVGHYINKLDTESVNVYPGLAMTYFLYVDVLPSMADIRRLNDLVSDAIRVYIKEHLPRNKVLLLLQYNYVNFLDFSTGQITELVGEDVDAHQLCSGTGSTGITGILLVYITIYPVLLGLVS